MRVVWVPGKQSFAPASLSCLPYASGPAKAPRRAPRVRNRGHVPIGEQLTMWREFGLDMYAEEECVLKWQQEAMHESDDQLIRYRESFLNIFPSRQNHAPRSSQGNPCCDEVRATLWLG